MFAQDDLGTLVNQLIRHYFDAKEDYRLAAGRATDEAIKLQLTERVAEREGFHMALQQLISEAGEEQSDNGTITADFKREWERARGIVATDGLDTAVSLAHKSDASAIAVAETILRRTQQDRFSIVIAEQHARLIEARQRDAAASTVVAVAQTA